MIIEKALHSLIHTFWKTHGIWDRVNFQTVLRAAGETEAIIGVSWVKETLDLSLRQRKKLLQWHVFYLFWSATYIIKFFQLFVSQIIFVF
jgi:hypothetical protein